MKKGQHDNCHYIIKWYTSNDHKWRHPCISINILDKCNSKKCCAAPVRSLYKFPWIERSFQMQDTSAAIVIQINVTTKQKITNLIFHTSLKSTFARSPNNNTGNGIRKTNLFIFAANSSSIQPSFLNSIPSTIIIKRSVRLHSD